MSIIVHKPTLNPKCQALSPKKTWVPTVRRAASEKTRSERNAKNLGVCLRALGFRAHGVGVEGLGGRV